MKQSTKLHWESFWQAKSNIHEVYSNADRILRNLRCVTNLRGKKILEVGSGTGRDSFPLVEYGGEVYQVDYSEHSLQIIKRLAQEQHLSVRLISSDAFALPFPDRTFDIVFHQGLLEHFRDQEAEQLLKENIRVLKPGGLLLIDVPQRYHIYTIIKHILIFFNRWFAGWEREFSIVELQRVLRTQGLNIIHSYGEWMYPSLFYRAVREVLRKVNVRLPMYPRPIKAVSVLRNRVRSCLWRTPLALYTSISIGVIAKKD